MSYAEITLWIMLATFGVLVLWDVYVVFFNKEKSDTISYRMRDSGSLVATLPFGWGVLGGHFWGPHLEKPLPIPLMAAVLALSGFAAWWVHTRLRRRFNLPIWTALIWMAAGVPLGVWLWPQ